MDFTEYSDRQWKSKIFRAWRLRNKRLSASAEEQKLIDLLEKHMEFAHFWKNPDKYLDYDFDPIFDDIDPFLHLLFHVIIDKQIADDDPPGIRAVYARLSEQIMDVHEVVHMIGYVFVRFFYPVFQGIGKFDAETYLEELQNMAADPNYIQQLQDVDNEIDDFLEEEENEFLLIPDIDQFLAEVTRRQRKTQDEKHIQINTKLQAALNKCPAVWVEAMSIKHERPACRNKRDRVKDLCQHLTDPAGLRKAVEGLTHDEREALATVLENGGWIKYGQLAKSFGDEEGDGWWWAEHPPASTIGRLRLCALLFVGRAPVENRRYKVAIIPKELRKELSRILAEMSSGE